MVSGGTVLLGIDAGSKAVAGFAVVTGALTTAFGASDAAEGVQYLYRFFSQKDIEPVNFIRDNVPLFQKYPWLYTGVEFVTTLSAGTSLNILNAQKNAAALKGIESSSTSNVFKAPEITTNSKGELTNGTYTLNQQDMLIHVDGKNPNKSQFLCDVDANKAKVPVTNGYVGVTGKGELTSYINVYRTKTGYIHGCPGNP